MNENEVTLIMPEATAHALYALIGNAITSVACGDLGLDELYNKMYDVFPRANLDGFKGLITRENMDVPVSYTMNTRASYIVIDVT